MENNPTKQYLDYLISKYTDIPNAGTNGKAFNVLQLNVNKAEFHHNASPQVIQTNQCKNGNTESNSSI